MAYLARKQSELDKRIEAGHYEQALQRVKAYLADNRVFGVDKNPIAVELAEISLWLNTIYQGHTIPWFGGQLAVGNSLIGARRQVFSTSQVKDFSWLNAVPEHLKHGQPRPPGAIYHFLLADGGMCNYTDKVIKSMCPGEMKRISDWRGAFKQPFDDSEVEVLTRLNTAVDALWKTHTDQLRQIRQRTAHQFPVWGQPPTETASDNILSTRERAALWQKSLRPENGPSSAYQRLKFVMDYWCALWFWPIESAPLLPSRDEFFREIGSILEGSKTASKTIKPMQGQMFGPEQKSLTITDQFGIVDINTVCAGSDRLKLVQKIAADHWFFHWDLDFADIFQEKGGFDLMLGNPPWIKIEWNEGAVIGDFAPMVQLRNYTKDRLPELRAPAMETHPALLTSYLAEYVESVGAQQFLNSATNYPDLIGNAPNSYKGFISLSWWLCNNFGVQGFLHPEGIFDSGEGKALRAEVYQRLRWHFQFQNALKLFPIGHREKFGVSVYGPKSEISFKSIANLLHPWTIDQSLSGEASSALGGIKDASNNWNIAGHPERVLTIDRAALQTFAALYDEPGTLDEHARLPRVHCQGMLGALDRMSHYPFHFGERCAYSCTEMWNQNDAVGEGTLIRRTTFPGRSVELVLSTANIWVSNPLAKTPRRECQDKSHFDPIDLTLIDRSYLPRTNFLPCPDLDLYRSYLKSLPWSAASYLDSYKLVFRRQLDPVQERTLVAAICPPGAGHNRMLFSVAFEDAKQLLGFTALASSLVADFYIKTTGKEDLYESLLRTLPIPDESADLLVRALMLNCLTSRYSCLWSNSWDENYREDDWAKVDDRLKRTKFSGLSPCWSDNSPLKTDFERRQALVEIDVLIAMELGLNVSDLCQIYQMQFSTLRHYEENTFYDVNGRIVYLAGDQSYGLSTPQWKKKQHLNRIERSIADDTLRGGPRERTIVYQAPFDQCDREQDYQTVWAEFERRKQATKESKVMHAGRAFDGTHQQL